MAKKRLSEEFGVEDAARLSMGGADPTKMYTLEDLAQFKSSLGGILASARSSDTIHKGVFVVTIYDPEKQIHYHTLCVNGTIEYARRDGKWDSEELHDSVDPLFRSMAREGVPTQTQVVTRKGGKGGDRRSGKNRQKPMNTFDTSLEKYIEREAKYLTYAAFYNEDSVAEAQKLTEEELEQCQPDLAEQAKRQGYQITAESIENFVARHRKKIVETRRLYVNKLMSDPNVTQLFSGFLRYVKSRKEGPDEFFAKEDYARDVYSWFKDNNKTKHSVSNVLVSIRDQVLNAYSDRSELRKGILRSTNQWVGLVEAAEYLDDRADLRKDVVSLFTGVEEAAAGERTYEAVRRLAKKVVIDNSYTWDQFKFMVKGLWMRGLMQKVDQRGDDEVKARSAHGTEVQMITPVSHLWKRFGKYDALLNESFEDLLAKNAFPEGSKLEVQRDYRKTGAMLFSNVDPDVRRTVFTHIHNNDVALDEGGSQLSFILTLYVGLNREKFLDRIAGYHGSTGK